MLHGLELSLDREEFAIELLDFFAGLVGVLHLLDEDLLRDPINLMVLLDQFLVQTGDLLLQEC